MIRGRKLLNPERILIHHYPFAAMLALSLMATRSEAQAGLFAPQDDITNECPAGGISDLNGGDCRVIDATGDTKYIVHVPKLFESKYGKGADHAPLLLDLVGSENDPNHQRQTSGQLEQSDRIGFIAVWPKPPNKGDNWDLPDLQYLKNIIADLKNDYPRIDPDRVYVTGHSRGGYMTHQMGCHASDVVRAIAPTSYPLPDTDCDPRNVSMVMFQGSADETVGYGDPYIVGTPHGPDETPTYPHLGVGGAEDTLSAWASLDGCASPNFARKPVYPNKDDDHSYVQSASGCGKDKFGVPVKVELITVLDAPHGLYPVQQADNPNKVNVAAYIWNNVFDGS